MSRWNSKRNLFFNGLTDTEYDSENENENNFIVHRKKRITCDTSHSEVEKDDEDNDDHCDTWTSKSFVPKIHPFTVKHAGIIPNISRSAKFIDYFELFVSKEFVQYIANETNDYWSKKENNNMKDVNGTSVSELYCFFALSFLMTRNKKLALVEYWSKDILLRSDVFGEVMARDRYLKLLEMLHFSHDIRATNDRIYKIRNIIDMLRKAFSESFYPYQKLCIDESLLLYKGRLSFKQYIPSKRSRFGIKSFILSDCRTGFVQNIIVYARSSTKVNSENKEIGKSGAIVETLMKPYLGKGHTLFVDNWYSSPALFNLLY
ncbi:PiggyBac transposable element-derived protein 4 [Anthophora retusa]